MESTISQTGLRQFTRALTTLAKYADDASISASGTELSLSSCSSSQSAFGRITFSWSFFDRYTIAARYAVTQENLQDGEEPAVRGSVNLKAVLSVLKNRNVQESVEKCDVLIIEGLPAEDGEPGEHVESKFVLRFHCKNGIVKTHRLSLDVPEDDLGPNVPPSAPSSTSRIVVGPLVVKDLLEHFGGFRKSDPQLQWEFDAHDVKVSTVMQGVKGTDAGLASEISVETSEFLEYVVPQTPVVMRFQWKEFDAATAIAESLTIPLNIFFTLPGEPLWIEVDASQQRSLFVISTAPASGYSKTRAVVRPDGAQLGTTLGKRPRTVQAGSSSSGIRKRAATEEQNSDSSSRPRTPTAVPSPRLPQQQRLRDADNPSFSMIDETTVLHHQAMDVDLHPPHPTGDQDRLPQAGPSRVSSRPGPRDPSPDSLSLRPRPRKERPLFLASQDSTSSQQQQRYQPPPESQAGPSRARSSTQRAPYLVAGENCGDGNENGGPPLSQFMSADALEQIRATGLGLEVMNERELDALMGDDDDDENEAFGNHHLRTTAQQPPEAPWPGGKSTRRMIVQDEDDHASDEVDELDERNRDGATGHASFLPATQAPNIATRNGKAFQPLFD